MWFSTPIVLRPGRHLVDASQQRLERAVASQVPLVIMNVVMRPGWSRPVARLVQVVVAVAVDVAGAGAWRVALVAGAH
jgi:hypothetical protein